jgi:hypothetical protein
MKGSGAINTTVALAAKQTRSHSLAEERSDMTKQSHLFAMLGVWAI